MSNSKSNTHQKYRPYLTLQQIRYFIELAESDNRSETEALKLKSLRELKLFIAKNDLGLIRPALVTVDKKTISEQLGLESSASSSSTEFPALARKQAYDLWTMNPQLCTEHQIKLAQLYRYENDLMSPDEEEQYESEM